jgi:glycosyltransferase involved in cell wall biosynthesis
MKRILLVTSDFDGITIGNGTGTYYKELYNLLSNDNNTSVDVLICRYKSDCKQVINEFYYFDDFNLSDKYTTESWELLNSHRVHDIIQLINKPYDIIEFHDYLGYAFIPIKMKRYLDLYKDTNLVIKLHGSTIWHYECSEIYQNESITYRMYMEKYCINYADYVISPSNYMIDYTKSVDGIHRSDFKLVTNPLVIDDITYKGGSKIVFFGRREKRKGLYEFIEYVNKIKFNGSITFVGPDGDVSNREIQKKLNCDSKFITFPTKCDSLKYM